MQLPRLIQWIVLAVILVVVLLALLTSAIVAFVMGFSLSPLWIMLVIVLGAIGGAAIFSTDRFDDINRQIEDQMSDLSDKEMLEVMRAMDEVKEHLGIEIQLPVKQKKRKREDIDKAIRNLSDTELLHLKDRLREGSIDEEKLIAWIESQQSDERMDN